MAGLDVDTIKGILMQSGIKSAEIFGSRARGDNRPDSDIDILIQFEEGKTLGLFEFVALERKLSETLGVKVDLITRDSLSPHIKSFILKDLKTIYQL